MRITGAALFGPQNGFMNVHHVNQSVSKQPNALQQLGGAVPRSPRDTLALSPRGKANSALSGLEKLKQQIEDRRNEYLSKAAEEGYSADVIQTQMDSFDQQIKDIDKRIAQLTIQQAGQEPEPAKPSTWNRRPKTRQEVENERLADITSLSTGLEKAKTVRSIKTQVDGDIGVKESEIELTKNRGGDTEEMEAELAQMQSRSDQLTAKIGDQLHETMEDIKESSDKMANGERVDPEKAEEKADAKVNGRVEEEDDSAKAETEAPESAES